MTKRKNIEELQVLTNTNIGEPLEESKALEPLEDIDNDEEIQASKDEVIPLPKKIRKPCPPKTPLQLQALETGRQKMLQNAKNRREAKEASSHIEKEIIEEKIVKKAISIKKKQIKKQAVLDDISDDETPVEVIKKIVSKQKVVKQEPILPVIPKFTYHY